jgi:hypothetical protein
MRGRKRSANAASSRRGIPEHSNEVDDLALYRACMNDHGEVE